MPARTWKHDELMDDLAAHLLYNKGGLCWTNMQLGPAGSPRPDVYVLPKSFSRFKPISYECKVSIEDFRRDVVSGKWQDYLQYSAGVIFAVPAGLVSKEDLPRGAGLIVRHDEVWRTAKGPTLSPVANLPRDAWLKLLLDGIERFEHFELRDRHVARWNLNKKLCGPLGKEIAALMSDREIAQYRLQEEIKEADKARQKVKNDSDRYIKAAREREENRYAEYKAEKAELFRAIGLSEKANFYEFQQSIQRIAALAQSDPGIEAVRKSLQGILQVVQKEIERISIPDIAQSVNLREQEGV